MLRENTIQALNDWGADIVKFSKINIGDSRRKRKSKMTGKVRKGKIDFTGKLRNSLDHEIQEMPNSFKMTIEAEDYIDELNSGKPHRARYSDVLNWVKKKPVKLRNKSTGRFLEMTRKRQENFARFTTWKLKTLGSDFTGNIDFGGKDVGFFDEAVTDATTKHEDKITGAAFRDAEAAAEAALKSLNNGNS